ncbi:MAG: hypothetical protein J6O71_06035 [Lachnospiraceae bacterium]|nr:hypothetical protein [Lachnospiraceae bacterium]
MSTDMGAGKKGENTIKIASSTIGMESARHYAEIRTDTYSQRDWGATYLQGRFKGTSMSLEENESYKNGKETKNKKEEQDRGFEDSLNNLRNTYKAMQTRGIERVSSPSESFMRFKAACINYLIMLFFGLDKKDLLGLGADSDLNGLVTSGQGINASTGGDYSEYHLHYESETTSYEAKGKVVTEDGREIEFGLSVSMSRSFMEESSLDIAYGEPIYCDPLVINMGSLPGEVSDQTFSFDIDADGIEDKISRLVEGSGFLALDKNGDGQVNDGSELFGATTGDGFEELAEYDEDKNGWIDENDSIFNKLRIWTKDEDGKDALLTLKEGDIGAISLQRTRTRFTVKSDTNAALSQVRSSGLFLHESTGLAGSIQQMDFAKQAV